MKADKLSNLRKKLDHIDADLVSLLEKRLDTVEKIGEEKNKLGMPLTDHQREQQILERLSNEVKNPVLKNSIVTVFSHLFELSKTQRILSIEKSVSFKTIGVIGTGLIGGSIIKALKMRNKKIHIAILNHKHQNIDRQFVDQTAKSIDVLVKSCDLIIIASPMDTIVSLAHEISKCSQSRKTKLIVMDCGSVKEKISREFEKISNDRVEFIPTHPMAGSDKSGFANAHPLLFLNQPWIITRHKNNTESSINDIYELIRFLGSNPVGMSAKAHDRKVALVSHLAFLISVLYFSFVHETDKSSLQLAGPGFRSVTRLAKGNALMHEQIFTSNNANITKQSKEFIKYFSTILSEKTNLESLFTSVKKHTEKLFK